MEKAMEEVMRSDIDLRVNPEITWDVVVNAPEPKFDWNLLDVKIIAWKMSKCESGSTEWQELSDLLTIHKKYTGRKTQSVIGTGKNRRIH
jgi:hypothetical protein